MATSSVVFQLKLNGGDRDKAVNVVDKLMQAAAGSSSEIPSFDAAGGKFYDLGTMLSRSFPMGLVAGVAKDRFMVVYTPSNGAVKPKLDDVWNNMGKGFGVGPKWDEAKLKLPKDSNAVFYLDVDTLRSMFDADMPSEAQTFLKPFKYVVMGSANAAANRGVLRIFFGISK